MSYRLIRESFPTARKAHRCIWCGETIAIGTQYRHEISYYDAMQNHHWHMECDADAQEYFHECGESEFMPYNAERPQSSPQAPDFHDDKPDERADRFVTTVEGDLDPFGRPMRAGT